ncbi:MAG TPA: magnesium transporter [Atopostipes sp.]|jgi:magnesium transporter|nr:magnesium transporter [Atopostipes sp.]
MTENNSNMEQYFEELFEAVSNDNRELFREIFLTLHERDQQELFHLLYPEKKRKIAAFLSPEEFAEIFEWMELENQEDAVTYLPKDYIVSVFNYLPTDTLATFVFTSQIDEIEMLLQSMDKEEFNRLQEVLSYEQETAGSIMTKEYFFIHEDDTPQTIIENIRSFGERAETIYYLYVVDKLHRLVGVLSLRDLLLAPVDKPISEVMSTLVISVFVSEDQEKVANIIQDYDLIAIPVITNDQRLVGIITVDDIMDILEQEATEDFQEFAGISTTKSTEPLEEESAFAAAKKRSPWIVILLFLSMITGGLINFFEGTLASVVSLAAFIPLIMGAAGNVGTQSLAVAVRNMNIDDEDSQDLAHVLKVEAETGALIGSMAGVIIFFLVGILYRDFMLAFIVGVSIFISITVAAVIGTLIPDIIQKMNFDPAVASGPFITTINDTLGLLIYFLIATSLLNFIS